MKNGKLYLIGKHIGNSKDMGVRAKEILEESELVIYETERIFEKLLVDRDIVLSGEPVSYSDSQQLFERVETILLGGNSVALIADFGYPVIADHGYHLGRYLISKGLDISLVAGPSIGSSSHVISLLPEFATNYLFQELMRYEDSDIQPKLDSMVELPYNMVVIDRPNRFHDTVYKMALAFGNDRHAALIVDLTQQTEEIFRGTLPEICERLKDIDPVNNFIDLAIVIAAKPGSN